MPIQPYLFFEGRCEEAIQFYQQALGAEVVMLMRYKDSPEPPPPGRIPAGSDNKIMHVTLKIGDAILMASDGGCTGKPNFSGFQLSLVPSDEKQATRIFDALASGGQVQMPLGKTFWSPCFGMLADKFGVGWMINMAP